MTAPVVELSQEVFERLEAYRRRRRLSRNAALLELLEQAAPAVPTATSTPGWLEQRLEGVPEEDEEVSPATRRRIEAARRSLRREPQGYRDVR